MKNLPVSVVVSTDVDDVFTADGILTRTAASTYTSRTITGTANQVVVVDGDGIAGNPTLSLPQSIATTSAPTFAGVTTSAANKVALEYAVPTEGGTVATAATTQVLILAPAGALTAITVNTPATPSNGQLFTVAATGFDITGVTFAVGTVAGAPAGLAEDEFATFVYRATGTTWYRCG